LHFGRRPTLKVKRELLQATDKIGEMLDGPTRTLVLAQSVKVFKMSNAIIKTVTGVEEIFYRRLMIAAGCPECPRFRLSSASSGEINGFLICMENDCSHMCAC